MRDKHVQNIMNTIAGNDRMHEPWTQAMSSIVKGSMMGTLTGMKDMATGPIIALRDLHITSAPYTIIRGMADFRENYHKTFDQGVNKGSFFALADGDFDVQAHSYVDMFKNTLYNMSGRNFMEQAARTFAFGGARVEAAANATRLASGKADKQTMQFMNQFATPEMIANYRQNKSATPAELDSMAAKAVESWQGSYDVREHSYGVTHGTLSPIWNLAKWNIGQMNRFNKYVVAPAVKEGNYWPLINSTLGIAMGGEFVNWLQNKVMGDKKEKFPTMAEIAAKQNETGSIPLDDLTYRAIGLASLSGIGGMYGDIAKMVYDWKNKNYVQGYNNVLMDAAATNLNLANDLRTAMQNGDHVQVTDVIAKVLQNNFQVARIVINNATDEGKANVTRANMLRDLRVFNQMHGLPVSDTGALPAQSYFTGKEERDWKRSKNLETAIPQGQELIKKILEDAKRPDGSLDIEKLHTDMRALKSNSYQTMPSPTEKPLSYLGYRQWLQKTQGDQEAEARTSDYLRQNAINRAKTAMVPALR